MKQQKQQKNLIGKILAMLSGRQKTNFAIIVVIMIVSAVLSQLLPLAIGRLTDDLLGQDDLQFKKFCHF